MKKYTRIKEINKALFIIECDKCKTVLASASERGIMPQFATCNCDETKEGGK